MLEHVRKCTKAFGDPFDSAVVNWQLFEKCHKDTGHLLGSIVVERPK
jgi:hypothetical protein